jgi:predicted  nucleic acid-binding Zn-ribbon protein
MLSLILFESVSPYGVIAVLFVLSLVWIFYLKGKFWRAILGPPAHEVLAEKAKAMVRAELDKMRQRIEVLRADVRAKGQRVREGASPLSADTLAQRDAALDAIVQKLDAAQQRSDASAAVLQESLASFLNAGLDILGDSVVELADSLARAEEAQKQAEAASAGDSINDLRTHLADARSALGAAGQATEVKERARHYDTAAAAVRAGAQVTAALRLVGVKC